MPQNMFNKITFLTGNETLFRQIQESAVTNIFSPIRLSFLNALSQALRKDPRSKKYEDVLAYAFWIRKASLEQEKKRHQDAAARLGRGICFHIAPSNVPINFAVSMTSAFLAGNVSIIRVSDKEFEQVDIICHAINCLFEEEKYQELKQSLFILRYPHDEALTQFFSSMADVRIIWGGDATIQQIRRASLRLRAIDMVFPDRYSLCVIDAQAYLASSSEKLAASFFLDTYYSDQGACSSPEFVFWLGSKENITAAKNRFWTELEKKVKKEYAMKPVQAVDKLNAFCLLLAQDPDSLSYTIHLETGDNDLVRLQLAAKNSKQKITPEDVLNIMKYKEKGGYFFEYDIDDLQQLTPFLQKECQTISYIGELYDRLFALLREKGVRGGDRIVRVGKTMELSFYWDGYDMIQTMSRYVGSSL